MKLSRLIVYGVAGMIVGLLLENKVLKVRHSVDKKRVKRKSEKLAAMHA